MNLLKVFLFPLLALFALQAQCATFNVQSYGAAGDCVTDDTAAINSAITAMNVAGAGVLLFPADCYQTTGSLTTISAGGIVQGEGAARMATSLASIGTLVLSSDSANSLFTIISDRLVFRDIALSNNAGSVPTSGAGITVLGSGNLGTRVDYEDVYVEKFYNDIDVQVGNGWTMRSSTIQGAVNYGIRIRNTVNGDAGDWSISDSEFYSAYYSGAAAIRIESSGGGKIVNIKINANGSIDSNKWGRAIDVAPAVSTSVLLISNSSFENLSGVAVNVSGANSYSLISLNGNEFGMYGNTNPAINITGQQNISIMGNLLRETGGGTFGMVLTNCNNVRVVNNIVAGYTSTYSIPGTTTFINLNGLGHN